jgi:hemolysin activation/secretion protein
VGFSSNIRRMLATCLLQLPLLAGAADNPPDGAAAAPVHLFPVMEFQVEGNTLLPVIDIERSVTPFLGIGKSIKDVEGARRNLEKLYHDRGFQTVLVNIPQQEVSNGVVRLAVTEAPVGQLQIAGSRYHSPDAIREKMPQLQEGQVPNFTEVQKELTAVNQAPDLHVVPVLRASTTPGKVDVELDVQDTLPLHAMFEVNNRYSPNTAELRTIGEVSYDNLFQRNQSISIQYQTAPAQPANAKIWSLSYVIPTEGGPVIALYAVSSDSNIAAVGSLSIIGNGNIYGLRVIEPLSSPLSSFYHNFTAGFDFKDFKQSVVLQGADELHSPIRYAPFSLDYNATWMGQQGATNHSAAAVTANRSNLTLDLGASFLVRFLGGTDAAQFAVKRYGADPNFIILRPSLQIQQILAANWSLNAKFDAQIASGPLISNEQYGAGGVDSVRGYAESERLGDNGYRASFELRTPQLLNREAPHITQSYLYLFTDAADLHTLQPLPGQTAAYRLASYGAGMRFKVDGLTADLDGARAGIAGYVTEKGAYSAQFRVNYAW